MSGKTAPEIADELGIPVSEVETTGADDDDTFSAIGDVLRRMADNPATPPVLRRAAEAAAEACADMAAPDLVSVGTAAVASFGELVEKHVDSEAQDRVEGRS